MKTRAYPISRFLLVTALALISAGLVHGDNGDGTKVPTKPGHRVRLIYYLSGVEGQKEADAIVLAVKGSQDSDHCKRGHREGLPQSVI